MTAHDCQGIDNATVVLRPRGSEYDKRDSELVSKKYAQKVVRDQVKGSPIQRLMVYFGLADNRKVR